MGVTIKHKQPEKTEPQSFNTDDVCKKIGVKRATLYTYLNRNLFPLQDIRVRNKLFWSAEVVNEWIDKYPNGIKHKRFAQA
jgi:predicted DNA-binding transcriptional regulator AlpA